MAVCVYTDAYMEVLVLDGKSYVKASKAAKDLGYATDYVGQLCRSGQVDAHLIGRTWYVNPDILKNHKVEKKRMSRAKAREYAKRTIAEHKKKSDETTNPYTKIEIRYEHDSESLLPETKKITVVSTPIKHSLQEEERADELTYENKGESVSMSGTLNVVDVTDGPIDDDTVILHPTSIHTSPRNDDSEKNGKQLEQKVLPRVKIAPVIERKTFTERLEESNVEVTAVKVSATTAEIIEPVAKGESISEIVEQPPQISLRACFTIVLMIFFASLATLPTQKRITYTPLDESTVVADISYTFSVNQVVSILSSKI
jgi:hypothetical protein